MPQSHQILHRAPGDLRHIIGNGRILKGRRHAPDQHNGHILPQLRQGLLQLLVFLRRQVFHADDHSVQPPFRQQQRRVVPLSGQTSPGKQVHAEAVLSGTVGGAGEDHRIVGVQQLRQHDSQGVSGFAGHSPGDRAGLVISPGNHILHFPAGLFRYPAFSPQHPGNRGDGNARFLRDLIDGIPGFAHFFPSRSG